MNICFETRQTFVRKHSNRKPGDEKKIKDDLGQHIIICQEA